MKSFIIKRYSRFSNENTNNENWKRKSKTDENIEENIIMVAGKATIAVMTISVPWPPHRATEAATEDSIRVVVVHLPWQPKRRTDNLKCPKNHTRRGIFGGNWPIKIWMAALAAPKAITKNHHPREVIRITAGANDLLPTGVYHPVRMRTVVMILKRLAARTSNPGFRNDCPP